MTNVPFKTTLFILVTTFLNFAGIGIILPILPFVTNRYVPEGDGAIAMAWLVAIYSLCQFITTPIMGALSDQYGRRPVLLANLVGASVGYFVFGIGGSLAVLFLGRMIEGITGGSISTIYAYAADITPRDKRTSFFGIVGAAGGVGLLGGPALGGLLYRVTGSVEAPLYVAGIAMLVNAVWGYLAMEESLPLGRRAAVRLSNLNPFAQLRDIIGISTLRPLLVSVFLWMLAFVVIQTNLSYLLEDHFGWTPDATGFVFTVVGFVGVVTQGLLVQRLLPRLGENRLAIAGLLLMAIGYGWIIFGIGVGGTTALWMSTLFVPMGNGFVTPALTGLLSKNVSDREQGRVQGGSQSIQALARVVGPLLAGWSYTVLGIAAPYIGGAFLLVLAALVVAGRTAPLPLIETPVEVESA